MTILKTVKSKSMFDFESHGCDSIGFQFDCVTNKSFGFAKEVKGTWGDAVGSRKTIAKGHTRAVTPATPGSAEIKINPDKGKIRAVVSLMSMWTLDGTECYYSSAPEGTCESWFEKALGETDRLLEANHLPNLIAFPSDIGCSFGTKGKVKDYRKMMEESYLDIVLVEIPKPTIYEEAEAEMKLFNERGLRWLKAEAEENRRLAARDAEWDRKRKEREAKKEAEKEKKESA